MADRGTWKIVVGAITLADYTDVVKRDPNTGGQIIQTEPLLGGAVHFRAARGNFNIARSMLVTKEFASNAASVNWFELCSQTFNGIYTVVITHKDHTGTETSYTVTNAAVTVECNEPIGVSLQATVKIEGGAATGGTAL